MKTTKTYKNKKKPQRKVAPINRQKTVKDFKQGDFIRINSKSPVYIRGGYDRELKRYELINTKDIYGIGRYVKGTTPANDDFTY